VHLSLFFAWLSWLASILSAVAAAAVPPTRIVATVREDDSR